MMIIVSTILGLIVSLILYKKIADYFSLLFYHRNYFSKDAYLDLYDMLDDEKYYQLIKLISNFGLNKYADYLKLHQHKRSKAYDVYVTIQIELALKLAGYIIVAVVLPMFVFSVHNIVYLFTFLSLPIWQIIYMKVIKDRGFEFYVLLMLTLILRSEDKTK